jgi:sugar phosphate isomerase/epimerase
MYINIKILSPVWGFEHVDQTVFLDRVRLAGYDGVDTWLPQEADKKKVLLDYLQQHQMSIVAHQHEAEGSTFSKFKQSFLKNLKTCAESLPLLINSHTGRDYFSIAQNLELIDIAQEFSYKSGITVAHETHRGRLGYCPQIMSEIFSLRKDFYITADFSHWVCVTESMLGNFAATVEEAIKRTRHIHARVGFEQGPQVPDPRAPEWQYAVEHFLNWWDSIVSAHRNIGRDVLTITTEFGPTPYMPTIPFTGKPVADQFEVNCYMKNLLRGRYNVNN